MAIKLVETRFLNLLVAVICIGFIISAASAIRRSKRDVFQWPPSDAIELIKRHNEIYNEKRVVKVRDGVHVAIGYALANMILLEGTDGIIIVDTTENSDAALEIYDEFQKITTKPLKGIIMTHFHGDHIYGASALLNKVGNSTQVNVYMHSSSETLLKRSLRTSKRGYAGASRQLGYYLTRGVEHLDSGIGPYTRYSPDTLATVAETTQTFDEEATYELAGIKFTLLHTPGETDDQITVWIPEWKVVLSADNIYEAFPNLYAIRGTAPRSFDQWYGSLDKVRRLHAEHMVPSHTRPVTGAENIYDIITTYRDAIQFIDDQTLRQLNKGVTMDEVAERVKLPPILASHPYLQEFYGAVSWSVRAAYNAQVGWFDGNPVNLNPLSDKKRAEKQVEFARLNLCNPISIIEKLVTKAQNVLEMASKESDEKGQIVIDELQWALELSSTALEAASLSSPFRTLAKEVKIAALRALGNASKNSNARNYYLTSALELEDGLELKKSPEAGAALLLSIRVDYIMFTFPSRLIAENCNDTMLMTVIFEFPDVDQIHSYTLRHCVLDYVTDREFIPKTSDAKLTMTSSVWKDILTLQRSVENAFATGDLILEGGLLPFQIFMDLTKSEE
ncbi:linear primary-alkylsulfatase-like [Clavelina lepadiformis]|uniref:linear primary-alkylsulfatase-like n=1 Tax=Clavelina lepadiformis TaxID=159417 RepID=UPI004042F94E